MPYTINRCENCICSQGLAGESLAVTSLEIPVCVLSNLTSSVVTDSCSDSAKDTSHTSQSGTTSKHSTENHGADLSMSSVVDSPVRTFQPLGKAPESQGSVQDCGWRWPESLAKYDHATRMWKTVQFSLLADSELYLGTWPRWGTMRDGELLPLRTLVQNIGGNGSGFLPNGVDFFNTPTIAGLDGGSNSRKALAKRVELPTPTAGGHTQNKSGYDGSPIRPTLVGMARYAQWPTADDANNVTRQSGQFQSLSRSVQEFPTPTSEDSQSPGKRKNGHTLHSLVQEFPTRSATDYKGSAKDGQRRGQLTDPAMGAIPAGGALNPDWVELLMGWPCGWTSAAELAPEEFQWWLAAFRDPLNNAWTDGTWERDVPRTAKIKDRTNRLKAIGNGQVPLVVAVAFKLLGIE